MTDGSHCRELRALRTEVDELRALLLETQQNMAKAIQAEVSRQLRIHTDAQRDYYTSDPRKGWAA